MQIRLDVSCRGFRQQLSRSEAHDDIVVRMTVPTRFGTGREPPLRDDDALVLLQ
jgi:hypothetical protein